jgi:hypothetical protein
MSAMLVLNAARVHGDLEKIVKRAQTDNTKVMFLRTAKYSLMGFAGPTNCIDWKPPTVNTDDDNIITREACFLPEAIKFAMVEIDRNGWIIRRIGLRRRGLQIYCQGAKGPVVHIDVAAITYIEYNVGPGFDSDGILPPALLDVVVSITMDSSRHFHDPDDRRPEKA